MPSLPLIPTPTCAVCIIPTSFAPSPIASVMAFTCFFTMSTISDFCSGDTLQKEKKDIHRCKWNKQEIHLEIEGVRWKTPANQKQKNKAWKTVSGKQLKGEEKGGWKAGRSTHGSVYCSSPGIRKQWFTVLLIRLCIAHCLCVYICVCAPVYIGVYLRVCMFGELSVALHPLDLYHWSCVYNRFCLFPDNGDRETGLQTLPLRATETRWWGVMLH